MADQELDVRYCVHCRTPVNPNTSICGSCGRTPFQKEDTHSVVSNNGINAANKMSVKPGLVTEKTKNAREILRREIGKQIVYSQVNQWIGILILLHAFFGIFSPFGLINPVDVSRQIAIHWEILAGTGLVFLGTSRRHSLRLDLLRLDVEEESKE